MKVCMLVEALPPAYSGAARQALHLAAQLRAAAVEVFFAGAQVVKGSPRTDSIEGFRVYRVPFTVSGKWTKLRALVGYCRFFWQQRRQFDILHIHGPYYLSLAAAMFAKYALGKKLVLKLTSIAMDTPSAIRRRAYPQLTSKMFQKADAIVCMSSAQYDDCLKHGLPETKLHKIPNGVSGERFRPPSSEAERADFLMGFSLSPQFHYVVFIGSIEPGKGVELLVDIAQEVYAVRQDVKFLLIGPDGRNPGEGYIRAEFVQRILGKIETAGLVDDVLLLGRKANTEEYLRVAALFLSTSRSEGFGTVLIEAMATSVPPIALNIPGVTTDIITSGRDGIIIEDEAPSKFAAAICELVDDEKRRRAMGSKARACVLEKFEFSAVAALYSKLYEELIHSSRF